MARAGIYKWDVKEARDRLIRDGKHPSIDAVRAALGDTGSKSTIHRHLKELEQEEAGSSKLAVSDALQTLVGQLAERLQQEGRVQVEAATARFDAERAMLNEQLQRASQEGQTLRTQLGRAEIALVDEKEARAGVERELLAESTRGVQLTEQVEGQERRLADHAAHQRSLEEKHEHFRAAAKEQRDQEQRRHEQQVQQLQAEVRQLNSTLTEKLALLSQVSNSAAALTAEVGALRAQLVERRTNHERAEEALVKARATISAADAHRQTLDTQLQEARVIEKGLRKRIDLDVSRVRDLELSAARAEALLGTPPGRHIGVILAALLEAERSRSTSLAAELVEARAATKQASSAQPSDTKAVTDTPEAS